jgi:esterase/lipase superfamily enzyme
VTLYASSKDRALLASRKYHKSKALRVGEVDDQGRGILTGAGFTSIDVSAVSTDFLGHSYFGDNISVITDLHELLLSAIPPDRRLCLSPKPAGQPKWWIFDRCRAQ